MHLESSDKRPTEYGQNLKEFVKQENFMIAASTLESLERCTGDLGWRFSVSELLSL